MLDGVKENKHYSTSWEEFFMDGEKDILVVGNGCSCTEIDYMRLPMAYKVMRFNEFYKEEKYYAGRKVDYCLNCCFISHKHCW